MRFAAPLEVTWSITNRCNLSCRFCLSEASANAADDLPSEQRERILEQIVEARVLNLYFTGGEPLLVPELPAYVARCRAASVHVTVTTNGTLLTPERVATLRDAGVNHVQVSINGSRPEINDRLMSPSYTAILQGLANLNAAGVAPRIKVTVTRENVADMPALVRLLDDFETEHIRLFEVGPLGRGHRNYAGLRPTLEELQTLGRWVAEEGAGLRSRVAFLSFTLGALEDGRSAACSLGNPNICSCQILHDGNLVPCTYAQVLPESNRIQDHGLVGAWNRLPLYRRYLDPNRLQGKCGRCEYKAECKGGCRGLAYLEGRGEWVQDPLCPHQPRTAGGVT